LTVSVLSVDLAYSAESTGGTLTKSAMKTILFQYSKYTYFWAGAVFRDAHRGIARAKGVLRKCGLKNLSDKLDAK